MMLRLLLSTLLALLVFFSLTPTTPVFAFEVSVAEENPELELYQPNSCFYYSVNELGTEDLSVDDLLPIIRRAFNAWEDVSGSFFYFLPSKPPTTTVNRAEINWDKGNVNLLVWHVTADDWYTDDRHTPRTVALTQVDYNTETGEILNADIEFNDFDFDFGSAMSGSSDVVDLQTVITHEIGHTIG
ncbi:MAG: hypothetical protein GY869_28295, partial [Planctomycetes bacterium]|nr:hypothetical protein [Planctomycetota bacterium]